MHITELRYRRVLDLGHGESVMLEAASVTDEGENEQTALALLRNWVEAQIDEAATLARRGRYSEE